MPNTYDAIVIGGGHNGLVNAAYLARAGRKVVVLEKRHLVGGAAVTEEIIPGYKFTEFSYVVSLLRPEIIRDLQLPRHGLTILPLPSTFTPMPNGDYLAAWDDHDRTRREIYRHSPRDAEAYDLYSRRMARMAMAVKPILSMVPPDPTSLSPKDLLGLARLGGHAGGLSEADFFGLAKLMTMSAADLLDEWFECQPLKAQAPGRSVGAGRRASPARDRRPERAFGDRGPAAPAGQRLDLLEREQAELKITDGKLVLDLPAHGFAAVRLE